MKFNNKILRRIAILFFIILAFFSFEKVFATDLSGTHSSGTKTYTIGNSGTYSGVAETGFTVSRRYCKFTSN